MRIQRKINTPFHNILRPLGTASPLRTSNDFNLAVAEVPHEELPKKSIFNYHFVTKINKQSN